MADYSNWNFASRPVRTLDFAAMTEAERQVIAAQILRESTSHAGNIPDFDVNMDGRVTARDGYLALTGQNSPDFARVIPPLTEFEILPGSVLSNRGEIGDVFIQALRVRDKGTGKEYNALLKLPPRPSHLELRNPPTAPDPETGFYDWEFWNGNTPVPGYVRVFDDAYLGDEYVPPAGPWWSISQYQPGSMEIRQGGGFVFYGGTPIAETDIYYLMSPQRAPWSYLEGAHDQGDGFGGFGDIIQFAAGAFAMFSGVSLLGSIASQGISAVANSYLTSATNFIESPIETITSAINTRVETVSNFFDPLINPPIPASEFVGPLDFTGPLPEPVDYVSAPDPLNYATSDFVGPLDFMGPLPETIEYVPLPPASEFVGPMPPASEFVGPMPPSQGYVWTPDPIDYAPVPPVETVIMPPAQLPAPVETLYAPPSQGYVWTPDPIDYAPMPPAETVYTPPSQGYVWTPDPVDYAPMPPAETVYTPPSQGYVWTPDPMDYAPTVTNYAPPVEISPPSVTNYAPPVETSYTVRAAEFPSRGFVWTPDPIDYAPIPPAILPAPVDTVFSPLDISSESALNYSVTEGKTMEWYETYYEVPSDYVEWDMGPVYEPSMADAYGGADMGPSIPTDGYGGAPEPMVTISGDPLYDPVISPPPASGYGGAALPGTTAAGTSIYSKLLDKLIESAPGVITKVVLSQSGVPTSQRVTVPPGTKVTSIGGKSVLVDSAGKPITANGQTLVRDATGKPALRLGDGTVIALGADGKPASSGLSIGTIAGLALTAFLAFR